MSSYHKPRRGDKFWDGAVEPQPNGKIIDVNWKAGDGDYDSKEVLVYFYDSEDRRTYTFGEIKHYYIHSRDMYRLNEADRKDGFSLTNGVDHNDPKQRGY